MTPRALSWLATAALALPGFAAASAADGDTHALAAALADLEHTTDSARINAAENFDSSFLDGIRQQQGEAFLTDQRDLVQAMLVAGHAAFVKAFETNGLPAEHDAMVAFDATHFSAAELAELIAFYRQPAAQKLVALQLARSTRPDGPDAGDDAALKAAMADPTVVAFLATPTAKKESLLLPDAVAAGEQATAQADADNAPAISRAIQDAAQAYTAQHPAAPAAAAPPQGQPK